MPNIREEYDVIVVGAGHAGCEAALAAARMGLNTICFTVSCESIAMMPCNPNIGGSSKGHLLMQPLFSLKCLINPKVLRYIPFVRRRISRITAAG